MFFFFFGDTKPELTKIIEKNWSSCPRCGESADLVEYDNVFRAFFIPVWRSAGSNPALSCGNCSFLLPLSQFQKLHGRITPGQYDEVERLEDNQYGLQCFYCKTPMRKDDNYCAKTTITSSQLGNFSARTVEVAVHAEEQFLQRRRTFARALLSLKTYVAERGRRERRRTFHMDVFQLNQPRKHTSSEI